MYYQDTSYGVISNYEETPISYFKIVFRVYDDKSVISDVYVTKVS